LGILAVSYASFEGEAKFFCDSLTLKVIPKASQFNLMKIQFFKSQINQGTRCFWNIT